jgi:hypothetical protein
VDGANPFKAGQAFALGGAMIVPAPQDIDAGTDDQRPDPGFESIGIAQGREVPPRAHEPVLDRVSREFVVPEDQSGGRVHGATSARGSTAKAS